MKIPYLRAIVYFLVASSLVASPAPPQNADQLAAQFRTRVQALMAEYSGSLIKYLKKDPPPEDFLDGLKALEQLDVDKKEIASLHDVFQKRFAQLEARPATDKDPAKAVARIDELLKLGDYLNLEDTAKVDLLEKKYASVVKMTDEKNRAEEAFGDEGVVKALISYYQENRQKREGVAFVQRVKKDFPSINAKALDSIEKEFSGIDAIGDPLALHFKSLAGEEIDIANLKGKVVLIDFWATWCGPCMKSLPEVLALYEKFHGRGMEIIGVSLDQQRDALEKVVRSRKIPWPQFFDGKGWQNEIASAHGVNVIPASLLVDQNSKVAGINLRGPELEAKVAQLLQQKQP